MNPAMQETLKIGRRLVELCDAKQYRQAMEELYAEEAKHVEAMEMGPDMPRVIDGKAALLEMNQWWIEHHEVHGCKNEGPYPHGDDRFAVWMSMEVTPDVGPTAGKRQTVEEVCLYTVKKGKISQVEFFWDPTGCEAS